MRPIFPLSADLMPGIFPTQPTTPHGRGHSPLLARLLLALLVGSAVVRAQPPGELRPWEEQALSVETGLLWQVGHNTNLSYRLVPTQLSWRSRETMAWQLSSSRVSVRTRLTLLGTWFQQGPESHYLAVDASPSVEWWNNAGTWCLYGGAGGGLGGLDSQDAKGAQGQDFTFNWFARFGVEHIAPSRIRWSAGVMFQHMSNGGQTNPNPGIDAVGLMLGWAWSF